MSENINNTRELLMAIREGRVPSERSGEYWSDDERDTLRRLYMDGTGISQIALYLQRSENAVVQQLIVQNLLTPPGNSRGRRKTESRCRCPKVKDCPYYFDGNCSCYGEEHCCV